MKHASNNPAKFDRCVKAVKKRGGAANAYAVCTAAGTRGNRALSAKQAATFGGSRRATAAEIAEHDRLHPRSKGAKFRKGNPADAAAQAFEEFHGRPSEEVVTVTRKIHYHGHLAAIGDLKALKGVTREGQRVVLQHFEDAKGKPAILCENEKHTQLFIEGGNQNVDLSVFGLAADHELQTLMEVRVIEYFTTKNHLGRDGGTAIYVHKFDQPYPDLIFDVPNKQLLFAGGGYSMPPEGIDH